jgi:hypothetical protein
MLVIVVYNYLLATWFLVIRRSAAIFILIPCIIDYVEINL